MIRTGNAAIIFILLFASSAFADEVTISSSVDKNIVSIDENLTYTVTIQGSVRNIPPPKLPGFKGFTPYSSSRSQNISIINGRMTASIKFKYVLVPTAIGKYTIEPTELTIGGKSYQTQPIDIEVVSSSQAAWPTTPQPPSAVPQPPSGTLSQPTYPREKEERRKYPRERLFIETHVDKLRAYVNEQITLTLGFYQAINLYENPLYSPPSTTGFWSEDMPPQRKYYKTVNGIQYLVTEIKTALFATSPGIYTIGPARLECKAEDLNAFFKKNPYSIFDEDPFNMFRTGKPVVLTSEPIKIEITALPEGDKPSGFKGDVGKFSIGSTIDKNQVKEDEAVTLRMTITGDGNIKTVSEPKVQFSDEEFKVYDSGSSENISKENYKVHGEKIYEKVIVPRKAGRFTIPAVSFSYFDPRLREYRTVKTLPLELSVSPSADRKRALGRRARLKEKEAVKVVGEDVRFIKVSSRLITDEGAPIYKNPLFAAINILPLIILPFAIAYRRHSDRLRADVRYARSRYAHPFAQRRLKAARELARSPKGARKNKPKEFCTEIHHALTKYLADKLNVSVGLTIDEMMDVLRAKGASQELADKFKGLIEKGEQARFAPIEVTPAEMSSMLKAAEELIVELNRQLR